MDQDGYEFRSGAPKKDPHYCFRGGLPGRPGEPGRDGFSPTVKIDTIPGGHRITIIDAKGPHVFDILDGRPGDEYITDGRGGIWTVPAGEGSAADLALVDGDGSPWYLPAGAGEEGDAGVTDGEGGEWYSAKAGESGGALPSGGTDGQYLVKDSAAEGGAKWAELPAYGGVWSVTPLVSTQTTLETAQTYLDRDIVVEAIPYAEVSNISGGMTATIGG